MIARQAILIMACTSATFAMADDPSFKFTTGLYGINGGGQPGARGLDMNLRNTSKLGNVWVGWYVQPAVNNDETTRQKQWRTGWDNIFNAGRVRLQPSIQSASGGFGVAASVWSRATLGMREPDLGVPIFAPTSI